MMTMIGYARVSTDGQSLDAQRASAGCAKIFAEKQSGVVTGRKELMRAIDALGAGVRDGALTARSKLGERLVLLGSSRRREGTARP